MGATKFVLFIVEGETDELALGRALTSLFASGEHPGPRFGIVRGDITSVHALGAGNRSRRKCWCKGDTLALV